MKKERIILIVVLIVVFIGYHMLCRYHIIDPFDNYNLANPGQYPNSVDLPLVDTYKYTGNKNVSSEQSNSNWWYYPIFTISEFPTKPVNSYEQITNNLKYRYNPDDGTCSRAEFCGTLYESKFENTNVTLPLPPAPLADDHGARVGYFKTTDNTLPFFNSNPVNILY